MRFTAAHEVVMSGGSRSKMRTPPSAGHVHRGNGGADQPSHRSPSNHQDADLRLRDGFAQLQAQEVHLSEYESNLRMREAVLGEREAERTTTAKLESELGTLRVMYERACHKNRLSEDAQGFLTREADTLTDALGELMLTRPLNPQRMRHLNQVAGEIADWLN